MHHVLQRPVGCEPVDEAVVRDRRHDEPRDLRQRLVDVERRRQRATGVGEHPQPLLGAALLREVVEDVDRHPHIAAVIEHGRGADDRPAPLAAVPEAVLQLPLRLAALHERDPARQLCERQRIAVLVEDLEPSDDLLAGRGEELRERVEAAERRRGLVRVDDPAVRGLRGDAVGDTAKDRLELRTGLADAILGAPAMRCGGDVARHRLGDADVRRRERAGTVAVQHEAPERAAGLDERDERHRTDALGAECVVQLGDLVVFEHVVHDEHGRIGGAALPRESPADGQPVVLREAAPPGTRFRRHRRTARPRSGRPRPRAGGRRARARRSRRACPHERPRRRVRRSRRARPRGSRARARASRSRARRRPAVPAARARTRPRP